MFTFTGDVMLHLQCLSPADIKGVRQSWGLAKDAAPFEVHGPAFYRLYDRDIFYLLNKENSTFFKECLRIILHGDITSITWGAIYLWMTTRSYRGTCQWQCHHH